MFLLLGSTGYVGGAFVRELQKRHLPYQTLSLKNPDHDPGRLLTETLHQLHPSFVINAAGWPGAPNVDATENHKELCVAANLALPALLAEVCAHEQIPLGHVSTGCIYNGPRPGGGGYTEAEAPNFDFRHNNSGFYSGCKALAEEVIINNWPDSYLWRLRYPFESRNHPKNYLAKLMRYEKLVEAKNSISHLDEFAGACLDCFLQQLPRGIYNITNPGVISTGEIVSLIRKHQRAPGKEFRFFASDAEFQKIILTPRAHCELDSGKLLSHGIPLTEVHEAVDRCLREWKEL